MSSWDLMTPEEEADLVAKMELASHLLPDPGGEVVRDLLRHNRELTKQNALLVEALDMVEWSPCDDDWVYCPWCEAEANAWHKKESRKHKPDCIRQKALAAVKGGK